MNDKYQMTIGEVSQIRTTLNYVSEVARNLAENVAKISTDEFTAADYDLIQDMRRQLASALGTDRGIGATLQAVADRRINRMLRETPHDGV